MTKTLYDPAVEERGREQGREQGRVEGREEGIRVSIIDLLSDLGEISDTLYKKIEIQKDMDVLKMWNKFAARAESLEEFEKKLR